MNRIALIALLLGICLGTAHAGQPQPLVLVKTIPLGAIDGRIDHMAIDAESERLYVSALTNDSLEVVDLKQGKRMRPLAGPKGPQGVMILPESHEIAVACGEDGVLRLYDEKLNLVRFVNELKDADNLRYDSASKRAYLGYGKALAVIDTTVPSKLAQVALDGHPEAFQVEKDGNNIYANVPQSREVVVIDKSSLQITAHWQMLEAHENFPMALDEANHRLFIGCRNRAKVLVYDTKVGSYIGKVDCVGEADDLYFDAERKRIYVTGGQGYITVISQVDPYLYKVVANITTSAGARTSLFDPASGNFYVAVPHHRDQSAAIWVYKTRP